MQPAMVEQNQQSKLITTRGYQQEMLEESLRRNIVIALDTGSGKTHIAVLRIKIELERERRKVTWFITPTVSLCEQQKDVISATLPVTVGMISGALEPDQWKDESLWRAVLSSNRVIVSTPQVLLDALRHGFVDLGRDISLLVFDEAHHAMNSHPYNMIMMEFYAQCKARNALELSLKAPEPEESVRPHILGLTASPIYGGNIARSLKKIEANLHSTIVTPRRTRDELARHVHRPTFKYPVYKATDETTTSYNLCILTNAVRALNIEADPSVIAQRARLARLKKGTPDWHRLDQRLSRMVEKRDTFVSGGLRDFKRAAKEICIDVGTWAADWYIWSVVELALTPKPPKQATPDANSAPEPEPELLLATRNNAEKTFLLRILNDIRKAIVCPPADPTSISNGMSYKTNTFIDVLLEEKLGCEAANEAYTGMVFVTRRDTVLVLARILELHPRTTSLFHVGRLLGAADNSKRHSFLDITRALSPVSAHSRTLRDFRLGVLNLLVCTAVAEEGLDVQACGSVIRWDRPMNLVSWAQSRGRARKNRSTFVILTEEVVGHSSSTVSEVAKWERMEKEIGEHILDERRILEKFWDASEMDSKEEEEYQEYRIPSTGAVVTLDSAISHLAHFCAILRTDLHAHTFAVYDTFPRDYPDGFHLNVDRTLLQKLSELQPGPFGATVTLPLQLSPDLRTHSVPETYLSKQSACRHAAFTAYIALYESGLLNDNLLPITNDKSLLEDEAKKSLEEVEKGEGLVWVTGQINPLAYSNGDEAAWWINDVDIDGLPTFHLLTKVPVQESPFVDRLFDPLFGPRTFTVTPRGKVGHGFSTDDLDSAREYTRKLFSVLYGSRMKWDDLSFETLVLPSATIRDNHTWNEWLTWAEQVRGDATRPQAHKQYVVSADVFGKRYNYPTDFFALVDQTKRRFFKFFRWRYEELTPAERKRLSQMYGEKYDLEIRYPIIEARPFVKRKNFLIPLPSSWSMLGDHDKSRVLLLPQRTGVVLLSEPEIQFSLFTPSIMRSLRSNLTAHSMRTTLFPSSLRTMSLDLLRQAITAPAAQEHFSYQILASLGDSILKLIANLQLLAIHPLWHVGYLTSKKDHLVSNASLAKTAIRLKLYRWIIRDRFLPKKWAPAYMLDSTAQGSIIDTGHADGAPMRHKRKNSRVGHKLSTKVLADIVGALIGAAYLDGGLSSCVDLISAFGLGDIEWRNVHERVESLLPSMTSPTSQSGISSYTPSQGHDSVRNDVTPLKELSPSLPSEISKSLSPVETMIGYSFKRAFLLVEALMHASCQSELASLTTSYERMEFLGDAVLDAVVTSRLCGAPETEKKLSPGLVQTRKSALINAHFLAYVCLGTYVELEKQMPRWKLSLERGGENRRQTGIIEISRSKQRIYLWQCMLHSSPRILDDLRNTFARFDRDHVPISNALESGPHYPWTTLMGLQAPKFFGDIIEAIIGAVYLDSHGDMGAVERVLGKLGVMRILDRVVSGDIDVRHPVLRLANLEAKCRKEWSGREAENQPPATTDKEPVVASTVRSNGVEYQFTQQSGRITCSVLIDKRVIVSVSEVYQGRDTRDVVRFRAAEQAIEILSKKSTGTQ